MAAQPDVDEALAILRGVTAELAARLRRMSEAEWSLPSNCPPWPVRQLAGHVIYGARNVRQSVEKGVAGDPTAPVNDEQRAAEPQVIIDGPPGAAADALERFTADLEAYYHTLSADQLEMVCFHRRGARPARWYIRHRLVELSFHWWDIQHSLDEQAAMRRDVAEFLLPTILESNLPRVYAMVGGGVGRIQLVASPGSGRAWLMDADGQRLEGRQAVGPADCTIVAPAETLAVLAYGRQTAADLGDNLQIHGDRSIAERFSEIIPPP
jgi:uncharacterized protein (TIGR03083 family)